VVSASAATTIAQLALGLINRSNADSCSGEAHLTAGNNVDVAAHAAE
jgi:hypothetical protein